MNQMKNLNQTQKKYSFYSIFDKTKEIINTTTSISRLEAARYFASMKQLSLKQFLNLFKVTK